MLWHSSSGSAHVPMDGTQVRDNASIHSVQGTARFGRNAGNYLARTAQEDEQTEPPLMDHNLDDDPPSSSSPKRSHPGKTSGNFRGQTVSHWTHQSVTESGSAV